MFSTSTLTTVFNSASSDVGYSLTLILGVIVGGTVALMALGYAIRHTARWITGRRF